MARRLAAAGYLVLVPDLYARGGSRPADLAADRVDALKRFAGTLPPGGLGITATRQAALERLPATERARARPADGVPHAGALRRRRPRNLSGAPHAFFDDTRPSYRVAAARDAWARTLAFLFELLG